LEPWDWQLSEIAALFCSGTRGRLKVLNLRPL
jgi:hypothetical protein